MDPFIGEIRMVGFSFAPIDWQLCAGQLLPVAQYSALYSLIGTMYGGDGVNNFGLPDMRGRVPIHVGRGYTQGQKAGSETVALTDPVYLPAHSHPFAAAVAGTTNAPAGAVFGGETAHPMWGAPDGGQMAAGMIGAAAGLGQPHENRMPYQCVNFIIATDGVFPPRS